MYRRWRSIFFSLIVVLASCSGGGGAPPDEPSVELAPVQEGLESLIFDEADSGGRRVRVKPNIGSQGDLLEYRDFKIQQAVGILESTKDKSAERSYYPVVVTMRRPISLAGFNRLIGAYNPTTSSEAAQLITGGVKALPKAKLVKDTDALVIDEVKFVSTSGGGKLAYETMTDSTELARLEAKIAMREMLYNGASSYQLIRGVISIRGGIHRDRLMELEDEPEVFLADIGPEELYEGTVATAIWGDVSEVVEKYGNY